MYLREILKFPRATPSILRHEAERFWHRRGVWWFIRLIPRELKYWTVVQAGNAAARANPHQVVPEVTVIQMMEQIKPSR